MPTEIGKKGAKLTGAKLKGAKLKGGRLNGDPLRSRCGCFLPDLTKLASGNVHCQPPAVAMGKMAGESKLIYIGKIIRSPQHKYRRL
jgi:hypothetical protein